MIIPSVIHLPEGEKLRIEKQPDGTYLIPNAYEGTHQEFFEGRLTAIQVPDPEKALLSVASEDYAGRFDFFKWT